MSGSGGNAFSDLLRAVLGEQVDFTWIAIGAAVLSAFTALVAAWIATKVLAAFERRLGVASRRGAGAAGEGLRLRDRPDRREERRVLRRGNGVIP